MLQYANLKYQNTDKFYFWSILWVSGIVLQIN